MGLARDPSKIVAFNCGSYQRSNRSNSPPENSNQSVVVVVAPAKCGVSIATA